MAKNGAAASKMSSALVAIDPNEMAALAGIELPDDGLSEANQNDVLLPTKTLNMKGTDKAGEEIPKTGFYDTVDESVKKNLNAVFLTIHKTNVFSRYDTAESRTKIICRSDDLVKGKMVKDGEEIVRPCKNCPDALFRKELDKESGKERNVRDCNLVHNVISYDQDEQKLFVIRFKKGALKEWSKHLNKHHLGKGKAAGLNRRDVPLFFFEAQLKGAMVEGGTHAVPTFERGRLLNPDEVRFMAEGASYAREHIDEITHGADKVGESVEGAADTSFDPNKYTGGEGEDFVESAGG